MRFAMGVFQLPAGALDPPGFQIERTKPLPPGALTPWASKELVVSLSHSLRHL
jgi:hypothetical protein